MGWLDMLVALAALAIGLLTAYLHGVSDGRRKERDRLTTGRALLRDKFRREWRVRL